MPNYGSQNWINSLNPGDSLLLFNAEQPAPPQASIAIAIPDPHGASEGISFEGAFGGAPGVFEVDIQESDTETGNDYILVTPTQGKITAVNANNVFRADFPPGSIKSRFLRALIVSRTNAVALTLKASR